MTAWDDYFASTAVEICPFMKRRPWLFVPKRVEVVVLELDTDRTYDELLDWTGIVQPELLELNLEVLPLHPDADMQLRDGRFTRRSPAPALNFIRRDRAAEAVKMLGEEYYKKNFPDDWQRPFPGLEDG
jgi:hypothetical protein